MEREKVIGGLQLLKVPFRKDQQVMEILDGAIELLREKEVQPEMEGDPGNGYWMVCDACHGLIRKPDIYCRGCGGRIRWDGFMRMKEK